MLINGMTLCGIKVADNCLTVILLSTQWEKNKF